MVRIVFPALVLCAALLAFGQDEGERFSLMARRQNPLQLPKQAAVAWATPLAGGSIEVLAVGPDYTRGDFEALADRLDMDLTLVPMWSRDMAASDEDGLRAFAQRLDKGLGGKPDVVILGNLRLAALPVAWLEKLIQYVVSGGGLLLSHVEGELPAPIAESLHTLPDPHAQAIARGLAETITPEWKNGFDFLSAGECGEGRVVRLAYGEPASFHAVLPVLTDAFLAEEAYRETYYALVARAAVWLAGREPAAAITGIESTALAGPLEEEIPPDLPAEYVQAMKDSVIMPLVHPFRAQLSSPAPERYTVRAQVRVPGRDLQLAWPLTAVVGKGDTSFGFAVPVGLGRNFLDVWLYDTGREARVADWFSQAITIEGWPTITTFQCSKPAIAANDSVDVVIEIPPQLRRMAEAPMAGQIVVRATDVYDRIVAEKRETLTAEGGRFSVILDFIDLPGNRVKVEVFASDRPGAAFTGGSLYNTAYDYTYLTIATPTREALRLIAEGPAAVEYAALPLLAELNRLGFDSLAGPDDVQAAFMASQEKMRVLPVLDLLETESGRACPNNPSHWQHLMGVLGGIPGVYESMGTKTFFVEAAMRDHDETGCRYCLDALREHLRGEYGDVQSLNTAWKTSYASWTDVTFPDGLGDDGSWAPAVDVQRYRERMLGNACILGHAGLQAGAPGARVGTILSETMPVRDIWFFATQLNALTVPHDGIGVEKLRSYRIPNTFAAAAAGANGSAAYASWLPWYAAFHEMSAVWLTDVYTDSMRASSEPAMTAAWSPSEPLQATSAQTAFIRRGLADVLAAGARESYGIAIYDSPESGDIAAASAAWYADRQESESAFIRILESLGYQYDFVCDESLSEGALTEYRVLVLPAVWSLSDAEIERIQAFHGHGGVLIADGLPGRYDEHGRRRECVPLAALFGAAADGAFASESATSVNAAVSFGETAIQEALHDIQWDRSVHFGDSAEPAVWLAREDAARTLLLNHRVDGGTEDAAARVIDALLSAEGFLPAANPRGKRGARFDGEVVSWTYGPARLVGLLRRPDGRGGEKYEVNLHLDGHVYDLGAGALVRKPQKASVQLNPGGVAMYSALPYEVTGVEIQPSTTKVLPGERLRVAVAIKTKDGVPDKHYVWVDLVDVQGDVVEPYSRGVVCAGGIGEVRLAFVLNEALGVYTLRARDVLTGMEASMSIQITLP